MPHAYPRQKILALGVLRFLSSSPCQEAGPLPSYIKEEDGGAVILRPAGGFSALSFGLAGVGNDANAGFHPQPNLQQNCCRGTQRGKGFELF
ncbi:unnamed protein product [Cuscuta epithymum]|uniref:Secreted protein n=1 Tax=Cuscuta epithymum TaxID=186058 RepID=A0AAV0EP17_9ASTE|nr:unnamed protein product [Cuscuta epithymum]